MTFEEVKINLKKELFKTGWNIFFFVFGLIMGLGYGFVIGLIVSTIINS